MNFSMRVTRVAICGLMAAAAPALADPASLAPKTTLNPLRIAQQCPAGYQWVAEGFIRGGKYRPARCVALVRGSPPVPPMAPQPPPPAVGQSGPRYGAPPGIATTDQLNREELGRIQGQGAR